MRGVPLDGSSSAVGALHGGAMAQAINRKLQQHQKKQLQGLPPLAAGLVTDMVASAVRSAVARSQAQARAMIEEKEKQWAARARALADAAAEVAHRAAAQEAQAAAHRRAAQPRAVDGRGRPVATPVSLDPMRGGLTAAAASLQESATELAIHASHRSAAAVPTQGAVDGHGDGLGRGMPAADSVSIFGGGSGARGVTSGNERAVLDRSRSPGAAAVRAHVVGGSSGGGFRARAGGRLRIRQRRLQGTQGTTDQGTRGQF